MVVALGDAILEPRGDGGPGIVARLIEVHAAHRADATIAVTEVPDSETGRYGIVIGSPLSAETMKFDTTRPSSGRMRGP